jgi:hypothetical protein
VPGEKKAIINHMPSIAEGNSHAWDMEAAIDEAKSRYANVQLHGDLKTVYIQVQYGVDRMPGEKEAPMVGRYRESDASISAYLPYHKEQIEGLDYRQTVTTISAGIYEILRMVAERMAAKGLQSDLQDHLGYPTLAKGE